MSQLARVLPFAIIGITASALLMLALACTSAMPPRSVVATTLLQSSLDDTTAITSPTIGLSGTTSLDPTEFVSVGGRTGARLVGEGQGKYISFPAATGSVQSIALDQGEIEFWYRPNYNAGADDDTTHMLLVVGDVYNAPRLELQESDRLSLTLVEPDWTAFAAEAGYHAPLWTAGQWVHVRAAWDTSLSSDALRLYVNDTRVDGGGVSGGWDLGDETSIGSLYVGSGNTAGDFVADGILDDLIVHDKPQPVPTATPTSTGTPAASAPTAASLPHGCVDRTDAALTVVPPALPLPAAGTPFADPRFCTTLRRVSDTSDSGGYETHEYSQLQAFSSDNIYLLLDGSDGFIIRRVDDLSPVTGLDASGWNDPRWHPGQPHVVVHFDSNEDTVLRLQLTSVDTLTTTTIYTFPAPYERIRVPQSWDEISEDGRWLAGMASQSDGTQVAFALNMQTRALGAQLPIPALYAGPCDPDPIWGKVEPDWVGVSPLGRYLVMQWARDGTERCSGLETFDLQTGAFVGRVYEGHQHGDLGVDSDGDTEFFMTFELAGPPPDNDRPALGMRVLPGNATFSPPIYLQVLDWGNGEHISCRGPNGVCLVTAGSLASNGWNPFEAELFLQYTDGSVSRLAHHRSSSCAYWVQPRATISRDGRYVAFASDWGRELDCGDLGRGDPFIIDLLADGQWFYSYVPAVMR